jgi:acyl-coenzyme A synthetase/AMP-(fatty) acid ligase
VVLRSELLARLNQRPATFRRLCQPTNTADTFTEVTAALVFGSEVVLFDMDFGEAELVAFGYSKAQMNQAAVLAITSGADWPAVQGSASHVSGARLGLFTSGSTGLPKLVWQSAANLTRAVKVSPRHAGAVWALAYNPTHVAGIQVYLQALANGCPVVDIYGLNRTEVLATVERHRVTHISATPSFYRLLLPADRVLPSVRSVTLGGESSDVALLGRLQPLFPAARFHNVYASTEAGTLLIADGDTFLIADGLEGLVAVREGRIYVHRSLLGEFSGQVSGVQMTEAGGQKTERRGQRAEDRGQEAAGEWYDTGDVVEVVSSEPLRFRIVARERDWVNVGGSKVNPQEVESVLGGHSGVAQVRVFGRKNSVMGHILCAEVVLAKADSRLQTAEGERVTEPALRDYAATRVQAFKVPRVIRFVDSLATTRTGKICRS